MSDQSPHSSEELYPERNGTVQEPVLEGKHIDTLVALVEFGPCWCGDVPSKSARDDLIKWGYAIDTLVKGEPGHHAVTWLGINRYIKHFGGETVSAAIAIRKAK